ncbi:cytosine deaminase [Phreatobacter aquaticus]|uniref:Cytosine deaminase n=1 Tax=Phreatobacter aquaticus TaxID=2570229 RepID=A0A4D7QN02_9HYPH|nr:cytosine deaminase [Phreatobacter aquaticus]QCK86856.1 cytosine deaminase [Phreatobacter aquaticus]
MTRHAELVVPGGRYVLRRARIPGCFLHAPSAFGPADADGSFLVDLLIDNGLVADISAAGASMPADGPAIDLAGRQVWSTLLDVHTHLDKGQVIPRAVPDGTLEGGARATIADRQFWTEEDIAARMRFGLQCAYVHGVSMIRTHLDSHEHLAPRSFQVFRAMRDEWAGRIDLQAVGLAPLAVFRTDWGNRLADLVLQSGGVLGGVTDALGVYEGAGDAEMDRLLDAFLMAAAERGLDVDLHVDQTEALDPFALPRIAAAVLRTKFKGRVLCGHCVSLALQPDDVARETIARSVDAGLDFVTLPTPMIYLQDRKPGRTPRWRGVTLAQELLDAGLKVAIGGDNCRDAWFPFGDHDMVDTLHQSVRIFHLDQPFSRALAMAGPMASDIAGAGRHGRIAVGAPADMILLSARTLNEAMCRPQADRIVLRRGKRVMDPLPDYAELDALAGMPA